MNSNITCKWDCISSYILSNSKNSTVLKNQVSNIFIGILGIFNINLNI